MGGDGGVARAGAIPGDDLGLCGRILADIYEVLEPIGGGTFGAVYRARHLMMDRIVALKVQKSSAALREDLIERFRREAKACWQLRDAGAVEVFDCRIDPSTDRLFIAMELLQGRSLWHHWSAVGVMPVAEAVHHVRRAAQYLAVAHRRGFVHRDLKPENLFICEDGTLRVLDFGSVLIVNAARLTHPGQQLGTSCYMPPEQTLRPTGQLDGRVDVYALGVVLHNLLTGTRFTGSDLGNYRVAPDVREAAPWVPEDLANLIRRATAQDAESRYQSMSDFGAELDRFHSQRSGSHATTVKKTVAPELLKVCAARSDAELPKTVEYNTPVEIADTSPAVPAGLSKSAVKTLDLLARSKLGSQRSLPIGHTDAAASAEPGSAVSFARWFIGALAVVGLVVMLLFYVRAASRPAHATVAAAASPARTSAPPKPPQIPPAVASGVRRDEQPRVMTVPPEPEPRSQAPRVRTRRSISTTQRKAAASAESRRAEEVQPSEPKLAPEDVVDPTF